MGSAGLRRGDRLLTALREARLALRLRRGLASPLALIHFVTNACNLRCKHCFYWKELNKKTSDLTLDEYRKLLASFAEPPAFVVLTGGEPMMYDGLAELARIYVEVSHARNLAINTNGFYPQRTAAIVEELCQLPANFHIQISLDGLEATHNEIRAHPKSFAFATETIRAIAPLRGRYRNLTLHGLTAISERNQHEIDQIGQLFLEDLRIPVAFELVRGTYLFHNNRNFNPDYNPKDPQHRMPELDALERIYEKVASVYEREEREFGADFDLPLYEIAKSIEMFRFDRGDVPCIAGNLQVVLYPDGKVGLCELFQAEFDLRDFDLDWRNLYASPQMERARRKVKGCYCNHGCFLQPSLAYHPKNIWKKFRHGRYVTSPRP